MPRVLCITMKLPVLSDAFNSSRKVILESTYSAEQSRNTSFRRQRLVFSLTSWLSWTQWFNSLGSRPTDWRRTRSITQSFPSSDQKERMPQIDISDLQSPSYSAGFGQLIPTKQTARWCWYDVYGKCLCGRLYWLFWLRSTRCAYAEMSRL